MAKKKTQEPRTGNKIISGGPIEPAPPQRTYRYQPQEDITAYELALMMPVFVTMTDAQLNAVGVLEQLPDNARRHWVEWEQE